jgi:DNA polymerase-1
LTLCGDEPYCDDPFSRAVRTGAWVPNPLLYIVDGSSYVFRAFYAVRPLTTSSGVPTNAVFGFTTMLQKLVRERRPTHLAVAFDPPKPSFRKTMSADYKAHRPPAPADLKVQLPLVREMTRAFAIPALELEGHEADDVIATLTVRARREGYDVRIVSNDKDLMQLVDEHVRLVDTMRDREIGVAEVREKFGVEPAKVVEVLALAGDTSDNIPGVPGIGDKTASQLIAKYGDVEGVLSHIDEIAGEKRREALRNHAADARLSRELATLKADVPLDFTLDELRVREPEREVLAALLRRLEFASVLRDLRLEDVAQDASLPPGETAAADRAPQIDRARYWIATSSSDLDRAIATCRAHGAFALELATTNAPPMRAHLCGVALAWAPGEACYIPVAHRYLGSPVQLPADEVVRALAPLFEDAAVRKIGHDLKRAFIVLKRLGVTLSPMSGDSLIAGFLLDPGRPGFRLEELSRDCLSYPMQTLADIAGRGKNESELENLDIDQVGRFVCERAEAALRLHTELDPRLVDARMGELYSDIELPLVRVLAQMELAGVRVDPSVLAQLGSKMAALAKAAEARIYEAAGAPFNIQSPKQLQEVLFTRLGLRPTKKTQTGFSTDSEVLEDLSQDHPLPALILDYRSVTKLKGTYVDALPALIEPTTGRIHTSFHQTGAATGRLSSSDPNLQNIPVRTELGREIRRAFVADPGHALISADYSQIELRLLAHASGDKTLREAFLSGEDIHTRTAAEVFGVSRADVTAELRTSAKAINFGILYGMGAFRLSRELRIPQKQAQAYIDQYFGRLPDVKRFIDDTLEAARRQGYVRTLYGRRRFLPELASQNRNLRAQAERIAVNTPIQGGAADLIKVAMVRIQRALEARGSVTRMILQVHDELLFDAPVDDVDAIVALAREEMEGAAALSVPLRVDVRVGRNWAEAH